MHIEWCGKWKSEPLLGELIVMLRWMSLSARSFSLWLEASGWHIRVARAEKAAGEHAGKAGNTDKAALPRCQQDAFELPPPVKPTEGELGGEARSKQYLPEKITTPIKAAATTHSNQGDLLKCTASHLQFPVIKSVIRYMHHYFTQITSLNTKQDFTT